MNNKLILFTGTLFALLAVIIGAFGAHGLEPRLSEQMLQRYHTAVDYQFYHSFALLITGLLHYIKPQKTLIFASIAFSIGILLFSGSLYAYAVSGIRAIAMITPIGGLSFICGWLLLLSMLRTLPNIYDSGK